jgi:hypothetical protein
MVGKVINLLICWNIMNNNKLIPFTVITINSRPLDLINSNDESNFIVSLFVKHMWNNVNFQLSGKDGIVRFDGEARFLKEWCDMQGFDYHAYCTSAWRYKQW